MHATQRNTGCIYKMRAEHSDEIRILKETWMAENRARCRNDFRGDFDDTIATELCERVSDVLEAQHDAGRDAPLLDTPLFARGVDASVPGKAVSAQLPLVETKAIKEITRTLSQHPQQRVMNPHHQQRVPDASFVTVRAPGSSASSRTIAVRSHLAFHVWGGDMKRCENFAKQIEGAVHETLQRRGVVLDPAEKALISSAFAKKLSPKCITTVAKCCDMLRDAASISQTENFRVSKALRQTILEAFENFQQHYTVSRFNENVVMTPALRYKDSANKAALITLASPDSHATCSFATPHNTPWHDTFGPNHISLLGVAMPAVHSYANACFENYLRTKKNCSKEMLDEVAVNKQFPRARLTHTMHRFAYLDKEKIAVCTATQEFTFDTDILNTFTGESVFPTEKTFRIHTVALFPNPPM